MAGLGNFKGLDASRERGSWEKTDAAPVPAPPAAALLTRLAPRERGGEVPVATGERGGGDTERGRGGNKITVHSVHQERRRNTER